MDCVATVALWKYWNLAVQDWLVSFFRYVSSLLIQFELVKDIYSSSTCTDIITKHTFCTFVFGSLVTWMKQESKQLYQDAAP